MGGKIKSVSLPCKLPSTVCLHHIPGTLVQFEITWSLISRTESKQNRCFLRVPATKTLHSPLSTGLVSTESFPFSDKELFHSSNVANHEYYDIGTSGSSASFGFGGLTSELLIFFNFFFLILSLTPSADNVWQSKSGKLLFTKNGVIVYICVLNSGLNLLLTLSRNPGVFDAEVHTCIQYVCLPKVDCKF